MKSEIVMILLFVLISKVEFSYGQTNSMLLEVKRTSSAYKEVVFKLMLAEANDYAQSLNLPENIPITTNSVTDHFISSPFIANQFGALGSFRTTNFSYGFGKGKHLCYITRLANDHRDYYNRYKPYAIDSLAINTNIAYQHATQYLAKAFVDIKELLDSSIVSVQPAVVLNMTASVYTVRWQREGKTIATVVLAEPKAELWTLRIEDPGLILRKPLEITNLDFLLSQTNAPAQTNVSPDKQ